VNPKLFDAPAVIDFVAESDIPCHVAVNALAWKQMCRVILSRTCGRDDGFAIRGQPSEVFCNHNE
jgi:hypothetical protein